MELSQDKVDLQLRTLKVISRDIKFMKIFLLLYIMLYIILLIFLKFVLQIYKENNEPT